MTFNFIESWAKLKFFPLSYTRSSLLLKQKIANLPSHHLLQVEQHWACPHTETLTQAKNCHLHQQGSLKCSHWMMTNQETRIFFWNSNIWSLPWPGLMEGRNVTFFKLKTSEEKFNSSNSSTENPAIHWMTLQSHPQVCEWTVSLEVQSEF